LARPELRVATLLAPGVLPLYARIAEVMAARLGRVARLTVADSYARCAAEADDVCFVCSVPYLLFQRADRISMEVLGAPVLVGDRYAGRPVYFSDVVVRIDSPAQRFADLRGLRWAYNEPFSHSGHLVVLHELAAHGEATAFFGEMIEAGFHDTALAWVASGRVDAAAIDSQVLAIAFDREPSLRSRLRIIGSLGPSTIQPVVASVRRLSAGERAALADVLLDLHHDPSLTAVMRAAHIDRFVPLANGYDDVAAMFGRVEDAGLLGAGWWDRWASEAAASARTDETTTSSNGSESGRHQMQ
jgi:phosphonate transport system substrate-binding protein